MRYQKLDLKIIAKNFKHYVRDRRHFRNHNLTASLIANEMNVSRTILSKAVNQELGTTIRDYINDLRLKFVNKLIEENKSGLTIEEISFLAGFSFSSTYYRLLKNKENERG